MNARFGSEGSEAVLCDFLAAAADFVSYFVPVLAAANGVFQLDLLSPGGWLSAWLTLSKSGLAAV